MNKDNFIEFLFKNNKLKKFYNLLESKNYDFIYELYGKDIYLLFTPISYKKNDISKLLEEKKYNVIYNKYGKIEKFFIHNLNKNIVNDINKLDNNGEIFSIYEKYGEKIYSQNIEKYIKKDIYNETFDISKVKLYKMKRCFTKGLKKIIIMSSIIPTMTVSLIGGINIYNQSMGYKNSLVYENELLEYNKNLKARAEYIKSLNLNDFQTIVKIIDDEWKNSSGYGESDYDIYGLWRLDTIATDNKVLCKSLSDDFCALINEINPEYNARMIYVNLDTSAFESNSVANVDRFISMNESKHLASEKNFSLSVGFDKDLKNNDGKEILFKVNSEYKSPEYVNSAKTLMINADIDLSNSANHVMCIMNITGEKYPLIVDPTNIALGTIVDGKIKMFSTINNEGVIYKSGEELIYSPISDSINYLVEYIKSYSNDVDFENLKSKYGTDSFNKELEYVRNLDNTTKIL